MDVRDKGFKHYIRIDEAIKRIEEHLKGYSLGYEEVNLLDSLDRVNYENIFSEVDIPSVNRAAMDGYSVKADDTLGATKHNPILLKLSRDGKISKGEAKYTATGSPIPEGADALVMVEEAKKISDEEIEVYQSVPPWKNIARVGEDVKKGELLIERGKIINPQQIALLAALGYSKIKVVKKPKIGIISTGNELVEVGIKKDEDQVYDVNRYSLSSLCKKIACDVIDFGIAKDDINEIRDKVFRSLKEAQITLISGGTSVGERDLIPDVINSFQNSKFLFHGVALRPGAPAGAALIDNRIVFLLPGYPVSTMVCFDALVKPIIYKLMGAIPPKESKVKAKMLRRAATIGGLRTYVRVKLLENHGLFAEPIRTFGAGIISSMSKADGIIIVPEDKEGLEEGEEVEVTLLR
ncbi:MAG: molybdopterin molybdotransferase MoeA [Nitrososphaerales archaeon]